MEEQKQEEDVRSSSDDEDLVPLSALVPDKPRTEQERVEFVDQMMEKEIQKSMLETVESTMNSLKQLSLTELRKMNDDE